MYDYQEKVPAQTLEEKMSRKSLSLYAFRVEKVLLIPL
jgi:hypothetical protein